MARFWQTPAVILYNAPDKHFVTTAVSVLKGCWFYPYCFFRCFFFQWQVYSNVWLFYIKRWVMWMNYELHIVFFSFFCFFFFTVRVSRSVKQIGTVEIIKLIMLHWRRQRIGTTHHLDSRPLYRGWTFQNSRFNNNNKVLLVLLSVLRKWFGALPK